MRKNFGKHLLLTVGVAAVVSLFSVRSLSGQRVCCQGDWWLKWNHDARETYVYGYTLGFSKGHLDGCKQGTKAWPHSPEAASPLQKCISTEPDFSKGSDYFVKSITEFYERYPKDRDIYINEVLDQLGKGLTLEQIHNQPFMRHQPSDEKP